MRELFDGVYRARRVFLTGHTGFKGSWLAHWLAQMGAQVTGFALEPETNPNHFELLALPIESIIGDILNPEALNQAIHRSRPEIVFHLAAQPLVRRSYRDPAGTVATNVMGTVHLFEACRSSESVRAIVNITTDKCYENKEWVWGYRENDPMGGHDPYSASKGCAELLSASWRNSFFHPDQYGKNHQILLASARAGNVIGGGDWGEDRLIPDLMRAVSSRQTATIRNPKSTRPWQHVLEPLSGYLLLGQKLLQGDMAAAQGWNFGPSDEDAITVGEVVLRIKQHWDAFDYVMQSTSDQPHEANLLRLDCSKARSELGWKPIWDSETALTRTVKWYKTYFEKNILQTVSDMDQYLHDAQRRNLCWTER